MTAQLTHQSIQARGAKPATPATPAGRGRLREVCHRIRLVVAEMNYASRRVVELQAPWTVDRQWHSR
jgi:hypothetical protein